MDHSGRISLFFKCLKLSLPLDSIGQLLKKKKLNWDREAISVPAGDLSKHSDNKLGGNLEVISHFSLCATEVCNDPDDHLWSSRYRTLMIIRESPDYYIWVKYSLVSSLGSTCQATPVPYFNLSEQACRISEEGCRVT